MKNFTKKVKGKAKTLMTLINLFQQAYIKLTLHFSKIIVKLCNQKYVRVEEKL